MESEPASIQRPSPEDFCDHDRFHDDLDGQSTLLEFLGLTIREAETRFASSGYESLSYMAPPAYCYYIYAALRHLTGESAAGSEPDDIVLSSFLYSVESRIPAQRDQIAPVIPVLRKAARFVLDHWQRFVPTDEEDTDDYPYDLEVRTRCMTVAAAFETAAAGLEDDPRTLAEILEDAADAADREPDHLYPVERQLLEAIVRAVDAGESIGSEAEALALIAAASTEEARKHPAYFAAYPMLRRRGLLVWVQDARGAWHIRPAGAAAERL